MLDVDFAVGAIPYFTSDVNANGIAAPFNFNFFFLIIYLWFVLPIFI